MGRMTSSILARTSWADRQAGWAAALLGCAAVADLLSGPGQADQATDAAKGTHATGWLRLQQPDTKSVSVQPSSQVCERNHDSLPFYRATRVLLLL